MNRTALHQVCGSGLLRTSRHGPVLVVLLQGMASYDETLTLELLPPVAGLEPLRALPPSSEAARMVPLAPAVPRS